MAFLTDLDSRAAIKGSRDPLATQSIWVPFGRQVIGNLSTVTTSVRDFTVLLLGFWAIEHARAHDTDETDLALFLKWEQLAGYARVEHGRGFRGVDRVRANLNQGTRVKLGSDRAYQILSNQKTYGLWGLYTVPARSSGLLTEPPMRLTDAARQFVERAYLPVLARAGFRDGAAIIRLILPPVSSVDVEGKDAPLVKAIRGILHPQRLTAMERQFYDEYLVQGGPNDDTEGRQTRLAALLHATLADDDFAFTPAALETLAEEADDGDAPQSLAVRLTRIGHCETMLAPAVALFLWLLAHDGARPGALADDVRKTWGSRLRHLDLPRITALRPELVKILDGEEGADRWIGIADDLGQGRYAEAIERVIEHNKIVMQQRGGAAPWIELRSGKLHVAFRDEEGKLPQRADLASLWRSSYFLDALRAVVGQVRGVAA